MVTGFALKVVTGRRGLLASNSATINECWLLGLEAVRGTDAPQRM
jgi:hypothetical protein